jgi:hypothetical protein
MNYLTCTHCQYNNPINSERTVFCKRCNKKLENNFIDWRKSKMDNSFETFLSTHTNKDTTELKVVELAKKTNYNFNVFKNKQNLALLSFIVICWFVVFDSLKNSLGYFNSENTIPLTEISWKKYQLGDDIKIDLPIPLKKQETRLGCYLAEMIGSVKSSHAETSSKSFSVTVEEIEIQNTYMLGFTPLLDVNDEFMTSSQGEFYLHKDLTATRIKNYMSYIDRGSYLLNGESYLYENYTLYKQNKAIKIIISYLENDKASNLYSDIIAKSLFSNNTKHI